jgi:peptidyl-prolyl cis-trans isomerase D
LSKIGNEAFMAKQEVQSPKTPTRRQLAVSKKEKEQLRLVYMGLGLVGILILIVLAIGLIQTFVIEPNSPVATVNGVQIKTGDYQKQVKYERFMLDDQYQQILQQLQTLNQPGNEQLAQLLGGQYQQYASQILQQRALVDRQALQGMIENELVKAEAQKRGITVSPEEVNEQLNRFLASRAGGLTALAATETATARAEASATAALWTPTPTFTPSPTLTSTGAITEPTATPANTPTPAPTSTPNILDENALSTNYTNWITTLSNQASVDEATYRQIVTTLVLKQKLQKTLGEEVPKEAEQVHARHILLETEDEAKKVVERLNKGEDFAKLAKELSKDVASGADGGDLGFVPHDTFVKPVDDAIFSLPVGQISEPVQSEFGWHVLEVLERESRELAPQDYVRLQRQAYTDWLQKARTEATIEDLWTADKAPQESNTIPTPVTQNQ